MSVHCLLGANCDSFDRRTKSPGISHGFNLCESCHDHSTRDVSSLVYDYVDLSQIIARRDGHSEAKISRPKPESMPPVDLDVLTLRSDIEKALVDAEELLRGRRPDGRVREGRSVQVAVAVVAGRVDILAAVDGGPEILHTLRTLHLRARALLGRFDLTIALPGACPKCHAHATLSRRDGSESVACESCAYVMPWDLYRQMVTLRITEIPVIPARLTRNHES